MSFNGLSVLYLSMNVKLPILADSGFGFTTKSQISQSKLISKPSEQQFEKTHTGHKSLRFPTPNICRFGTLWCNRNHPSSKAWLSHPGATQDGIGPNIWGKALRSFLFGSFQRYHHPSIWFTHKTTAHAKGSIFYSINSHAMDAGWCWMHVANSFQPCSRSPSTFCPP